MSPLPRSTELPAGGAVVSAEAVPNRTGSWRTGLKPQANLDTCVNCLLCWVYCPDSAVLVEDGVFQGFDLDACKGCQICDEMCPVDAIRMIPEEEPSPALSVVRAGGNGHG